MQPLLVAVRELPPQSRAPGARRFEAVERIVLLGLVPVRNRIVVELTPVAPPARVDFHATSRGGVEVWSEFRLEPAGPGATDVREDVRVRAPRGLRRFVVGRARHAQEALLARLKRRLEAAEPGGR